MNDKIEVSRLDWRTLFKPAADTPADTMKVLDTYFACFAQPPFTIGEDGKNDIGDHPCLKCGKPLAGGLMNLVKGGGFTWGLVHGEGHCAACHWPARCYHFIKDADGKDLLTIRNVILQYHPDFVTEKKRKRTA